MDHDRLLNDITQALSAEPAVEALFLAGSHGRSAADRYSDIDLVALVAEPHHASVSVLWRDLFGALQPVVYWSERGGRARLINAITEDWLRCDHFITSPMDFTGRSQATVKPLIDWVGVYEALPERLPDTVPDARRVRAIIDEFIRVMGLATVGAGRGEYVTLARGVALLRDLLSDLLLQDCPLPDKGGALHLSQLLPADQMALLAALPYPGPHRDELIEAYVAVARAFFPRARDRAQRLNLDWPDAFYDATRRHFVSELGVDFGPI